MMKAYLECSGILLKQSSLKEALGLSMGCHRVISFVGAGGKTSLMYQLASELSGLGKRVIVTTSTHIAYPANHLVVCPQNPARMTKSDWEDIWNRLGKQKKTPGYLVVGMPAGDGKLKGLGIAETGMLLAGADVLLAEADGAKRLPLKVPANHEPVIIPETDLVIACAGLDCVGRPFKEACFRFEEAGHLLHKPLNALIATEDVASILASESGGRKQVGERDYCVVLNKADNQKRMEHALEIGSMIKEKMQQEAGMQTGMFKRSCRTDETGNMDLCVGMDDNTLRGYRCVVTTFAGAF